MAAETRERFELFGLRVLATRVDGIFGVTAALGCRTARPDLSAEGPHAGDAGHRETAGSAGVPATVPMRQRVGRPSGNLCRIGPSTSVLIAVRVGGRPVH